MFKKLLLLVLIALFMSGCASTLNPYSGSFQCPITEEGKCVPIGQAYQESITGQNYVTLEEKRENKNLTFSPIENEYSDALFNKLVGLIKDPKTPMLVPPRVVRVMILPYQDETGRELYSTRYIYAIIEDSHWILQNAKTLLNNEQK